jgi:hypothetical protein
MRCHAELKADVLRPDAAPNLLHACAAIRVMQARPVVLESGFVSCEGCLAGLIKFHRDKGAAGAPDPVSGERGTLVTRLPAVCAQLHASLHKRHPEEYTARLQQVGPARGVLWGGWRRAGLR